MAGILKKSHVRNIIVCEGVQSFTEIIKLTELLAGKRVRISVHVAGSKGITGELHTGIDL